MEQGRIAREGGNSPIRYTDLIPAIQAASVAQDGQDGQERIHPDVMAFIMQAAQASHLARLRHLEEAKIPTGELSRGLTISSLTTLLFPDPLIAFTLINDGPSSVFVEINSNNRPNRAAPILTTESYSYDAVFPVIEALTLDVDAGASAAIRIRAKTGHSIDRLDSQMKNPLADRALPLLPHPTDGTLPK